MRILLISESPIEISIWEKWVSQQNLFAEVDYHIMPPLSHNYPAQTINRGGMQACQEKINSIPPSLNEEEQEKYDWIFTLSNNLLIEDKRMVSRADMIVENRTLKKSFSCTSLDKTVELKDLKVIISLVENKYNGDIPGYEKSLGEVLNYNNPQIDIHDWQLTISETNEKISYGDQVLNCLEYFIEKYQLSEGMVRISNHPLSGLNYLDISNFFALPKYQNKIHRLIKQQVTNNYFSSYNQLIVINDQSMILAGIIASWIHQIENRDISIILINKNKKMPGKVVQIEYETEEGLSLFYASSKTKWDCENACIILDVIRSGAKVKAINKIHNIICAKNKNERVSSIMHGWAITYDSEYLEISSQALEGMKIEILI